MPLASRRRWRRPLALAAGGGVNPGRCDESTDPAGRASGAEQSTTLVATLPQEPSSWNYWQESANALRFPTFYNVQETVVEVLPDGIDRPDAGRGLDDQ